jgi:alpha-1,2-glucosyltransferase
LYFLALGWNKLFGCDIDKLRFLNSTLLGFLFTQILFSRDIIDLIQRGRSLKSSQSVENFSFLDWFKAFNIITFPPLFFFSALFYTDVASTIIVYLFFQLFLDRLMSKQENMRKEIIQVVLGIGALLFRQTNVFWVAIFPTGLAIIQGTKAIAQDRRLPKGGPQPFIEVMQQAWNDSIVYDPPVAEAWLDDYIKAGLSISIVAALNIGKIIPSLYPFLMLVNVFAAFVVWNGGVVLGMLPFHSCRLWRAPY